MCHLGDDEDVETATSTSVQTHLLQQAAHTVTHATDQMKMMMVGTAVLTAVLFIAGLALAIAAGGMLADARAGFSAGLAAIVGGMVMVVSWGALRGHATILTVVGPLLTAIATLQKEVAEIQARQERETEVFNELLTQAADQVARRRRAGG